MSAPETSQALPVFSVEVTETTTTRYRVRAADADRAQDVATGHNIDEAARVVRSSRSSATQRRSPWPPRRRRAAWR